MRRQRDKQHRKTIYDAELYELPLQLSGSLLVRFQKKGIKTVAQFMNADEEKFFEDTPDSKQHRLEFAAARARINKLIQRDGVITGAMKKPNKNEKQRK
ncbi:MAG: hypothetical protein CL946_06530, partial [Ectothiorhodospiraceae bacterium]|nr:hypothetical protein [Ectothiorhodospiraceae bacterium]